MSRHVSRSERHSGKARTCQGASRAAEICQLAVLPQERVSGWHARNRVRGRVGVGEIQLPNRGR
jgi:hypothetical protein